MCVAGWEVKQHAAAEYWRQWPVEDRYKMHFYNTPFDIDQESPDFPLNILKRIYRPGDYVVVSVLAIAMMACKQSVWFSRLHVAPFRGTA